MVRGSWGTALVAAVAITTAAQSAAALNLSKAEANCRATLADRVGKLSGILLKSMSDCHKQRLLGKSDYPANIDCTNLALLPQRVRNKIDSAEGKFATAAEIKCVGSGAATPAALGFIGCAPPCAHIAIDGYVGSSGVTACLICETKAQVASAMLSAYGQLPNPPVQNGKTAEVKCLQSVALALTKYNLTRMKVQQKCQYLKDTSTLAPHFNCMTVDLRSKIAKARTRATTKILGSCSNSVLANLTSCGATLALQQECAAGIAEETADRLFRAVFEPAADLPTATPTPSLTPTPSETRTSTPTFTPTWTQPFTPTPHPGCPAHLFRFDITSSGGAPFTNSQWQGGWVTRETEEGCSLTVRQPMGDIVLVGTTGDPFEITGFTGFTDCVGVGGEDGDGCQVNSCPPAGIGSCLETRPSCSAGLNGDATASFFVQCSGLATPTSPPSPTPTQTPVCPSRLFHFDVSSSGGAAFSNSQWPGGSVTETTDPGCSVTVAQPSGDVVLVGATGDSFNISSFTGFTTCVGVGGEDGDGCQVNSCPPAGIGSCQAARPSCSAGLNGDATARYSVQCTGQAPTQTPTPTITLTPPPPTLTPICPSHLFRFDVSSSGGAAFSNSQWPGGSLTQTTDPGCGVTVAQPSGDVVLVGTTGDSFAVSGFSGFTSCVGIGGEDGDGCQVNSCPPAGIGSCQSARPSCSAGLNGDATSSYFVQCTGLAPTQTPTPTITMTIPPSNTPTLTPVCPTHLFQFQVASSGGGAFSNSQWPGGTVTQTTDPGCGVTIAQPSGDVVLVGATGDPFQVNSFTGFANCVGIGGEDGDGCQVNSCPPAGIGSCQSARPSCSAGLNGDATSTYFVQCTGMAATATPTSPPTHTPTRTPTAPPTSTRTHTVTPTPTSVCPSNLFTFSVNSSGGGAFSNSQWPGGSATQTIAPSESCSVTIKRPSGDIVLAGTTGDSFEVQSFTGFTSCTGTGGEDGDGCQVNSCPPAGIAYCQSTRPSCSSGLNGNANANYFVQCIGH